MHFLFDNDRHPRNIHESSFAYGAFQFFNPSISDNDEHLQNIQVNFFAFDTFQFFNPFISNNDLQPENKYSKLYNLIHSNFLKHLYLIKICIH